MTGHLAVVAGVDDDGVVEQSGGIQPAHQLTDAVVDEVDAGVVRLTRAELLLGGQVLAYLLGEAAARIVVEPVREVSRQLDRRYAVAIAPDVAAGGGERRVRAAVGRAQEPRGVRLGVLMLQQEGQRLARDHVLLQEALRDLRDARSRRPGVDGEEVDGVDLMAQPVAQIAVRAVLEPLHLVGAAEVHLADQAGPVAVRGEVAGPVTCSGKITQWLFQAAQRCASLAVIRHMRDGVHTGLAHSAVSNCTASAAIASSAWVRTIASPAKRIPAAHADR